MATQLTTDNAAELLQPVFDETAKGFSASLSETLAKALEPLTTRLGKLEKAAEAPDEAPAEAPAEAPDEAPAEDPRDEEILELKKALEKAERHPGTSDAASILNPLASAVGVTAEQKQSHINAILGKEAK